MENLYLPWHRYIVALKRIREQIANGLRLRCHDNDDIGSKSSGCTWGLCSSDSEQWPEAEDHMWPEKFPSRLAPQYRQKHQLCPFDKNNDEREYIKDHPSGCFYRCSIFWQKETPELRAEALRLYDQRIAQAEAKPIERK
jgi:hypothetical protein